MSKRKIKVDVVSDVVCPWCYIGKRRLDAAIRKVSSDIEVEVNYLPFELNPNIPVEGTDQKRYLATKFGGDDRYRQLTAHVVAVASQEGLRFDFAKQSVMPNTLNAHRLIQLAGTVGVQASVKEALMKAYFEDGVDLSSVENLVNVAERAGLDRKAAEELLETDKDVAAVRKLEDLNRRRGITGVPFFIINDKYGVSGAQPSDTLAEIFKEADAETALNEDKSCEIDQQDC